MRIFLALLYTFLVDNFGQVYLVAGRPGGADKRQREEKETSLDTSLWWNNALGSAQSNCHHFQQDPRPARKLLNGDKEQRQWQKMLTSLFPDKPWTPSPPGQGLNEKRSKRSTGSALNNPRDLLIIFDSSDHVTDLEYTAAKNAMADLVSLLCNSVGSSPLNNRVAAIHYSTGVHEDFAFDRYSAPGEVREHILSLNKTGGDTCTNKAMRYAREVMLSPTKGLRADSVSTKDVLLLASGSPSCGGDVLVEAAKLQRRANVYALSVRSGNPNQGEIESYVSKNISSRYLFSSANFQDVPSFSELITNTHPSLTCVPLSF